MHQTQRWLGRQGIDDGSVILSPQKGEIAQSLCAAYMIDDKAGNCIYAQYQSPRTKVYILDAPYNQFDPRVVGSKVKRVKTVSEFLDVVEEER